MVGVKRTIFKDLHFVAFLSFSSSLVVAASGKKVEEVSSSSTSRVSTSAATSGSTISNLAVDTLTECTNGFPSGCSSQTPAPPPTTTAPTTKTQSPHYSQNPTPRSLWVAPPGCGATTPHIVTPYRMSLGNSTSCPRRRGRGATRCGAPCRILPARRTG